MAQNNSGKDDLTFKGNSTSLFGKKATAKSSPTPKSTSAVAPKDRKVAPKQYKATPADKPMSGPGRSPSTPEKSGGPAKRYVNNGSAGSEGPSKRYSNGGSTASAAPTSKVTSANLSNSRPASPAAPKQLKEIWTPTEFDLKVRDAKNRRREGLVSKKEDSPSLPKKPYADTVVDTAGDIASKAINSLGSTSGSMTPQKQPRRNKAGQPVPD